MRWRERGRGEHDREQRAKLSTPLCLSPAIPTRCPTATQPIAGPWRRTGGGYRAGRLYYHRRSRRQQRGGGEEKGRPWVRVSGGKRERERHWKWRGVQRGSLSPSQLRCRLIRHGAVISTFLCFFSFFLNGFLFFFLLIGP